MERRMFVLSGLGAVIQPAPYDEWGEDLVKLLVELEKLARGYFGCPKEGEFEAKDCRLAYGEMDFKQYSRAKKQAMEFFGLQEIKK